MFGAASGIDAPGDDVVRIGVHADAEGVLLEKPLSHPLDQAIGDAFTAPVGRNVDPFQLSIAGKSLCSVPGDEAYEVSALYGNKAAISVIGLQQPRLFHVEQCSLICL